MQGQRSLDDLAQAAARFDPAQIGDELDLWLAERESRVPNLRPSARKRVIWHARPGDRTPVSIVYLHGFSASSEELRPVPDQIAQRLGANLHFARLAGHGRDGAAMAESTLSGWVTDLAEAIAIGTRIGDRVLLVGTSTGGTLAVLATAIPTLKRTLAGIVLVSPNFRVKGLSGRLIELPGARHFIPLLVGNERGFEPRSAGHAEHWTTRYPSVAVAPLGELTRRVRGLDFALLNTPTVVFLSTKDKVVDAATTLRLMGNWGGPCEIVPVTLGPGDDPSAHVIAGDILSPGQTGAVVKRVVAWASALSMHGQKRPG